jgi:hypothetical protein
MKSFLMRDRTKVETEVRFVWSTNREAEVMNGNRSRKGVTLTFMRKSSGDLSMASHAMHLAVNSVRLDGKERLV